MKKIVIAVLVAGLLSAAGTAIARGCRGQRGGCYDDGIGNCWQTNRTEDPMAGDGCPGFQGGDGWGQCFVQDCRREFGGRGWMGRMGEMGDGWGWNAADMPEDIRAKANELEKLRIDLRDALSRTPIDRAAATRLHNRAMQLEQEIGMWAFGERMDRIEAFRNQ